MRILSIQGIHAGVGASTLVANVARMLHELNQDILVFDLNPNNMLRLHFNMDWQDGRGWAANVCEGKSWHEAAFLCEQGVHFLPFGRVDDPKYQRLMTDGLQGNGLADYLEALALPDETWVLLNVPSDLNVLSRQALKLSLITLRVLEPSVTCLAQLAESMQSAYFQSDVELDNKTLYVVNKLMLGSEIDQEMALIFKHRLAKKRLPVNIHFDEHVKEAFAHQTTLNAYVPESASAHEFRAVAVWLMGYFERVGSK